MSNELKWCPLCHESKSNKFNYCDQCNTPLDKKPVHACGEEIFGHYKYCPKCGKKLEEF